MGNAESSSLGGTAIKVAAAVAAAAAVAWAFSSPPSPPSPPPSTPPPPPPPPGHFRSPQNPSVEGFDELQMLNVPVDYRIRRRDPIPDNHQIMMLEIDDGDDDDDGQQQQLPLDPIQGTIKIMSYNIFNIKYIKLHERMEAIGKLIQRHSPDIILFQEVTPNIYNFFRSCKWWGIYECSVRPENATRQFFCMLLSKLHVKRFFYKHFESTMSGKGLSVAKITTGSNKTLIIATCHLKSPTPGNKYIAERVNQAKEALDFLKSSSNVVLGGDMNWDDSADGPFPLIGRWCDAWSILRPDENGYTYDTESNGMLNHSRSLQKRLDRFICRLKHFKMINIEIIGTEAIPGVSYKSKGKKLPVLPSDHYGLILTISPK